MYVCTRVCRRECVRVGLSRVRQILCVYVCICGKSTGDMCVYVYACRYEGMRTCERFTHSSTFGCVCVYVCMCVCVKEAQGMGLYECACERMCRCERLRHSPTFSTLCAGVVHETHRAWARLVQGTAEKEVCMFVCVCGRVREKERDSDAHTFRVCLPYTKHFSEGGVCV